MSKDKSHFTLLAGTLLHDPVNYDVRYRLTPKRLAEYGDDLALRHLAYNYKNAVKFFEKPLPENLDQMIEDYKERFEASEDYPFAKTEAAAPVKSAEELEAEKAKKAEEDAEAQRKADELKALKAETESAAPAEIRKMIVDAQMKNDDILGAYAQLIEAGAITKSRVSEITREVRAALKAEKGEQGGDSGDKSAEELAAGDGVES